MLFPFFSLQFFSRMENMLSMSNQCKPFDYDEKWFVTYYLSYGNLGISWIRELEQEVKEDEEVEIVNSLDELSLWQNENKIDMQLPLASGSLVEILLKDSLFFLAILIILKSGQRKLRLRVC